CSPFELEQRERQAVDRLERRTGRIVRCRSAKGENCRAALLRRAKRGRDRRRAQGVGGDRHARLASGSGLVVTANQRRGSPWRVHLTQTRATHLPACRPAAVTGIYEDHPVPWGHAAQQRCSGVITSPDNLSPRMSLLARSMVGGISAIALTRRDGDCSVWVGIAWSSRDAAGRGDAEARRNTRRTSFPDWLPSLQGYAGKSKPASAETAEIVRLRSEADAGVEG